VGDTAHLGAGLNEYQQFQNLRSEGHVAVDSLVIPLVIFPGYQAIYPIIVF